MGAFEDLMLGTGDQRKAYDKFSGEVQNADTIGKQRMDEFSRSPLGILMSGLAFVGPRGGLTMGPKPLPLGGAPPPPGNYFRPSPLDEPISSSLSNPLEIMMNRAAFGSSRGAPARISKTQMETMGRTPDEAISSLEGPTYQQGAATNDLAKAGADYIRRQKFLIDRMQHQPEDTFGPWGIRPYQNRLPDFFDKGS